MGRYNVPRDGELELLRKKSSSAWNKDVRGNDDKTKEVHEQIMIEMRDKYQDQVYFESKPHPSFRNRLLKYGVRGRQMPIVFDVKRRE